MLGFGHRFHKSVGGPDRQIPAHEDADPRVRRLLALADELEWSGVHLRRVREIGRLLYELCRVPINIDGVAAGLLLDMGFASEVVRFGVRDHRTAPEHRSVARRREGAHTESVHGAGDAIGPRV